MYHVSIVSGVNQFASYLLTPYALYSIYLLLLIGLLWFRNEGKELITDITGKNFPGIGGSGSSAGAGASSSDIRKKVPKKPTDLIKSRQAAATASSKSSDGAKSD